MHPGGSHRSVGPAANNLNDSPSSAIRDVVRGYNRIGDGAAIVIIDLAGIVGKTVDRKTGQLVIFQVQTAGNTGMEIVRGRQGDS